VGHECGKNDETVITSPRRKLRKELASFHWETVVKRGKKEEGRRNVVNNSMGENDGCWELGEKDGKGGSITPSNVRLGMCKRLWKIIRLGQRGPGESQRQRQRAAASKRGGGEKSLKIVWRGKQKKGSVPSVINKQKSGFEIIRICFVQERYKRERPSKLPSGRGGGEENSCRNKQNQ